MIHRHASRNVRVSRSLLRLGLPATIVLILLVISAPVAFADTPVCGDINSDTTWNAAGSPYTVTCNVHVMSDVTLTIEAGVTVKLNLDTSLRIDGELLAQDCTFTANSNPKHFGDWDQILFTQNSVDAVLDNAGDYVSGSKIESCLIEWGGGYGFNGAIETAGASPFIYQNTIQNSLNRGIHAVSRVNNKIVIKMNNVLANHGDGIYVSNGQVISNTVCDNVTGGFGGAGIIAVSSGVMENTVCGNHNGGIRATGGTISGNTITGNVAAVFGGGIFATSTTIIENNISGNHSSGNGGGIDAEGGTISNNSISGNSADISGGGLSIDGTIVTDNTITDNTATFEGGGVYAIGGTISDNTLSGNSGRNGGALYLFSGGTATLNTIHHNTTAENGTLYIENGSASQNTIQHNTVGDNGGGIYGEITTLSSNTIDDNSANFGGGIYATLNSNVSGNTVTNNTAGSDGGGIYADGGTVNGNTVSNNSTPSFGHGLGLYLKGDPDVHDNTVTNNMVSANNTVSVSSVDVSTTAGGVSIEGQPALHHNDLYGNQPYDAEVVSGDPVNGSLNYWGQIKCKDIPSRIYDGVDLPGRGILRFKPPLYPPAVPELKSPPNGVTALRLQPLLKWKAADCAATYNVFVKNTSTGKLEMKRGLTVLKYKTKTLISGGSYKWWVQACNVGCKKSKVWTFTTQ